MCCPEPVNDSANDSTELAVSACEVGVVLPGGDASGRTPFYDSLARRVAGAGFVALLPDLYFRVDPRVKRDPAAAAQLDYQQTMQALGAAVDWLRARRGLATATFYGFPSDHLRGDATDR